ncbi:hypothetical protein DFH28DRAFT_953209 [Melampsora americana]|nr:hypothetical protein DFH28DRAFT_953209 [Melampsora americana]
MTPTSIEIDPDDSNALTFTQTDQSSPTRPIFQSKSSGRLTLRQRRFSRSLQSLSREFNLNGGESSFTSRTRHKPFRKWQAPRDSYMEIDSDPDECPEDFQVVVAVVATVTAKPVLTPLVTPKQSAHFQQSDLPEMPTNISAICAANFPENSTSASGLPAISSQDGPEFQTGQQDDGLMENISAYAEHKAPKSPSSNSSFGSSADLGLNRSTGPSLSSSIGPSLRSSIDPSSESSCGISSGGGSTPSAALAGKSPVMNPCLPLSIQPNETNIPSFPKPVKSPIHATHLTSEIPRRGSEGTLPKVPTKPKRSGTLPSRKFTRDILPVTVDTVCPWELEHSQDSHRFIKTTTPDLNETTDIKSISSRYKHKASKEKMTATSFFRKLAHKISAPNKSSNRLDSPVPKER